MSEGNSEGPFSRATQSKVKYLACAKCRKRLPSGRKEPLCCSCTNQSAETPTQAQETAATTVNAQQGDVPPMATDALIQPPTPNQDPPAWALQLSTGIPKLAACLDKLDQGPGDPRTKNTKRPAPLLVEEDSDGESPSVPNTWEEHSLSEGEISSDQAEGGDDLNKPSSEALDNLISAVFRCLDVKEQESSSDSSSSLFKRQKKSTLVFPSHQQLDSLIQSEWEHPERKFQANRRFQRLYPFSQDMLDKWSSPPSVDAPVSRLSKHTALPVPDASSFKDSMDKKMEGFLRAIFTASGEALRPVLASAWVSRASQSWSSSLIEGINSGMHRQDLLNIALQLKEANDYICEASLDATQVISRASALSVAARRTLWLKLWSADLSSKKSLTTIPFKGKLLFGPELDKIISQATGGKSTLLPQPRARTSFRRGRFFRPSKTSKAPTSSRDFSPQNSGPKYRYQNRPKPNWQNRRTQSKPSDKTTST
uniref:Lamina-associated polypeptide 2 alpha C-terminal domain-containing protein n=1 Tax=Xenopus tropicalis TaxID=8364 RepID=A0A803JZ17_XENTR